MRLLRRCRCHRLRRAFRLTEHRLAALARAEVAAHARHVLAVFERDVLLGSAEVAALDQIVESLFLKLARLRGLRREILLAAVHQVVLVTVRLPCLTLGRWSPQICHPVVFRCRLEGLDVLPSGGLGQPG